MRKFILVDRKQRSEKLLAMVMYVVADDDLSYLSNKIGSSNGYQFK